MNAPKGGKRFPKSSWSLVDSVVNNNNATYYGGGFMAYGYEDSVTVELNEVDIRDNTAAYIGGGAFALAQDDNSILITCTGSTGTTAGFTANSATGGSTGSGGGLALYGDASFEADTCDFGTLSGGDDNSPDDVSGDLTNSFDYDDDETFTCVSGYCGVDSVYSIGSTNFTNTGVEYVSGNVILADTGAAVRSFGMKLASSSASCMADFYVLYNTDESASGWTVLYSNLGVSVPTSTDYVDSGTFDLASVSGSYYALVAGSTCSSSGLSTTYNYRSLGGTDAGFGTVVGYTFISGYTTAYAEGDSIDVNFVSDYITVDQEVTILER